MTLPDLAQDAPATELFPQFESEIDDMIAAEIEGENTFAVTGQFVESAGGPKQLSRIGHVLDEVDTPQQVPCNGQAIAAFNCTLTLSESQESVVVESEIQGGFALHLYSIMARVNIDG